MCVCVYAVHRPHICRAMQLSSALRKNICTHFTSINSKLSSGHTGYKCITLPLSQRWDLISLDLLKEFIEKEKRICARSSLCSIQTLCFSFDSIRFDSTCLYCSSVRTQKKNRATKKKHHSDVALEVFFQCTCRFYAIDCIELAILFLLSRMLSSSLVFFPVFDLMYRFYHAQ